MIVAARERDEERGQREIFIKLYKEEEDREGILLIHIITHNVYTKH